MRLLSHLPPYRTQQFPKSSALLWVSMFTNLRLPRTSHGGRAGELPKRERIPANIQLQTFTESCIPQPLTCYLYGLASSEPWQDAHNCAGLLLEPPVIKIRKNEYLYVHIETQRYGPSLLFTELKIHIRFDFHSLRHMYISGCLRGSSSLKDFSTALFLLILL